MTDLNDLWLDPDHTGPGHGMKPECIDAYEAGDIWHVRCDCGNEADVCGHCLRAGLITSCGECDAA